MARKRIRASFVQTLVSHKTQQEASSPSHRLQACAMHGSRRSTRRQHSRINGLAARLIGGILGGAVILAGVILSLVYFLSARSLPTVSAHQVLWADTAIGTVADATGLIGDYDSWRQALEAEQAMSLSQASCLSYAPVTVEEDYLFSDEAELLSLAKSRTQQTFLGVVLQVAGHDVLAMTDNYQVRQVLEAMVEKSKTAIMESLSTDENPVTELPAADVTFAEDIQVVDRVITAQDAVSVQEAVDILSQTTGSAQTAYTIQQGDTLAKIASAFDTTQEALLEANPELESADLIVVGQELRLRSETRLLNVVLSFTQTRSETVPHTTQKKNSSSLAKGKTKVTQEGVDGTSVITARDTYLNGAFASRITLSEKVETEMVPEIITVGTKVINASGNPVFPYPVSGYRISSRFGPRNSSVGSSNHKGIDLAVPMGTPVYASADGTVYFSGTATGYGLVVYINHEDGYQTRYAHNSKLVVKKGETVKKGQLIAYAGNTGVSSGPHCHFEIRKDGVALNPEKFQ